MRISLHTLYWITAVPGYEANHAPWQQGYGSAMACHLHTIDSIFHHLPISPDAAHMACRYWLAACADAGSVCKRCCKPMRQKRGGMADTSGTG